MRARRKHDAFVCNWRITDPDSPATEDDNVLFTPDRAVALNGKPYRTSRERGQQLREPQAKAVRDAPAEQLIHVITPR